MPLFNEILQSRFNNLIGRLFGMEKLGPAPSLSPEIQTVAIIHPEKPEDLLLKEERIFAGIFRRTAGVGAYSHVGLYLPSTATNMIAVVERTTGTRIASGGEISLVLYTTPLANVSGQGFPRDLRMPLAALTSLAQIQHENNAAQLGVATLGQWRTNGSDFDYHGYPNPIVLIPGTGVLWQANDTNIQLSATFAWRERKLRPEEFDV